MQRSTAFLGALVLATGGHAQLVFDPEFDTSVADPAFATGEGPVLVIDEGHNNYHTETGRYQPFADVLRSDGYRVSAHRGEFTADSLTAVDVVVIASAIADGATEDPSTWLPVESAFSKAEIAALVDWVRRGGGLFLIVDYMPFPGWSAELAAAFGVHLANGYAYDGEGQNHLTFSRAARTLQEHPITAGRSPRERVESFRTFAGTALLVPYGGEPLLLLGGSAYVVLPEAGLPGDTAPPPDAPRHSIEGWSQGAAIEIGEGRLAVFGEAGAFSAQRYANGGSQGMNHPQAKGNKQALLNVVRWLSGVL